MAIHTSMLAGQASASHWLQTTWELTEKVAHKEVCHTSFMVVPHTSFPPRTSDKKVATIHYL